MKSKIYGTNRRLNGEKMIDPFCESQLSTDWHTTSTGAACVPSITKEHQLNCHHKSTIWVFEILNDKKKMKQSSLPNSLSTNASFHLLLLLFSNRNQCAVSTRRGIKINIRSAQKTKITRSHGFFLCLLPSPLFAIQCWSIVFAKWKTLTCVPVQILRSMYSREKKINSYLSWMQEGKQQKTIDRRGTWLAMALESD